MKAGVSLRTAARKNQCNVQESGFPVQGWEDWVRGEVTRLKESVQGASIIVGMLGGGFTEVCFIARLCIFHNIY